MGMLRQFVWVCVVFSAGLSASAQEAGQAAILFNGGISLEERASAPQTGVKLEFFVRAGNYLSAVSVSISTEAGREVLNTVTEGPWLILQLPAGRYRVTARLENGESQSLVITVDGTRQQFGFMFTSVE